MRMGAGARQGCRQGQEFGARARMGARRGWGQESRCMHNVRRCLRDSWTNYANN